MIYKLGYSRDKKISGSTGVQSSKYNDDYEVNHPMSIYNYKSFDKVLLPIVFLNRNVPFTDFVHTSYFTNEIVLSERVKEVLLNLSLPEHCTFLPIEVVNSEGKSAPIRYFLFIYRLEMDLIVDFKKSTFKHYDYLIESVNVIGDKSFYGFMNTFMMNKTDIYYSDSLVLKKNNLDIFCLDLLNQGYNYFSENAVKKILKLNLTGSRFVETNEIYGDPPLS